VNLGETSRPSCGSHDTGRAGRTARFGWLLLLVAQPAFADSHVDCSIEGACCFPRGSPPVAGARAPRRATIAAITVADGALARPAVKRMLGNRTAALGACTSGNADVTAHLVVAPSGGTQVTRIVAKPQVGHAAEASTLAACATEALRATTFPITTGVTELDVRITW
jgi:hypothetical protein